MIKIEPALLADYNKILEEKKIHRNQVGYYLKWLRYYLDFCSKYEFQNIDSKTLPIFIDKLRSKKQNENQVQQASRAVQLFYSLSRNNNVPEFSEENLQVKEQGSPYRAVVEKQSPPVQTSNNKLNQSWVHAYQTLAGEIKVRHYSPKTLKSYSAWVRKFQTFTRSKSIDLLDTDDVKKFLTYQAVELNVSASSQNLAFNALLLFFRNVLGKEFGKIDGIVRAKKRPHIPVVLSIQEVESVLKIFSYPYDLVVKLLYGCGLRLFESVNIRVKDFNFDAGILTIQGKGGKYRTVPIPKIITPALKIQMDKVYELNQIDIANDFDGAFMFDRIEKKYQGAGKEFVWQWFFPAKELTYVKEVKENRRYHLHDSHVQKAIKKAVGKARLTKRATAHTFRHSYATHMLEANYDIRTIQELLGHSDIRTTMIYTHTIKSRTLKEAKSPLDF
jgi:integron integrase